MLRTFLALREKYVYKKFNILHNAKMIQNKPEQAIKLPSNLYIWDTKTLSKIQKWKYNIIRTNEQHVSFWV